MLFMDQNLSLPGYILYINGVYVPDPKGSAMLSNSAKALQSFPFRTAYKYRFMQSFSNISIMLNRKILETFKSE